MNKKQHIKVHQRALDRAFKDLQNSMRNTLKYKDHAESRRQLQLMQSIVFQLANASFEHCSQSVPLTVAQPNRSVSRMFQDNSVKRVIDKYLNKAYRYLNRINSNLANVSVSFEGHHTVKIHSKVDAHALPTHHIGEKLSDHSNHNIVHHHRKAYLEDGRLTINVDDDHRMTKIKHGLSTLYMEKARLMSLIAMTKISIAELEEMMACENEYDTRALQLIERDLATETQCLAEYERKNIEYDKQIARAMEQHSVHKSSSIKAKYRMVDEAAKLMDSLDEIAELVLSHYPDVKIDKNKEPKSNKLVCQTGLG